VVDKIYKYPSYHVHVSIEQFSLYKYIFSSIVKRANSFLVNHALIGSWVYAQSVLSNESKF